MNLRFKKGILFFSSLLVASVMVAQTIELKGKITDARTSEPLPYVNIGIKDQSRGTFSDSNGWYRFDLVKGTYLIFFSYVGYDKFEKEVKIDGKKNIDLDIALNPVSQELNTVVVSGSKYAQKVQESISSIEVMKAKAIDISNIPTVDKAVDKVPGVAIIDNEPQIRGGSGFSSGLGSRVMIMVDEIPLLRGDAGRPNWDLLPIDDIEQIEVVKGASSVVYGSSAINGAINVRTAWPKENPETKVNTFWGMYSKPFRIYDTPWSGTNPMVYGLTISHSHIFDNYDLSGGISYYNDQGYIRGVPENKAVDSEYNGGTFNRRLKAYFNTRVRSKKVEGLSYGLNGTFYYSENAQNFFWYDSDTNIYRAYPGALSLFHEFSFYVDPFVKYFGKNGSSHALKNRVFYTNSDGTNNQSSLQVTVYDEYQFTHKFQKIKDMTLVAGITNIFSYANGKVFSGQLSAIDSTPTVGQNGTFQAENFAAYAQIEKKFFNRLTILFGGRYEYYHLENLNESKPIFRVGLNLHAARGTFLRASVGQGYRVPSIGERYITTNSGNFGFYPNPSLTSETSTSYEVGIKQLFKFGKFAGMADLAGFYEDYRDYVEFNFGSWGKNMNNPNKNVGFKFFNTGPARIYGVDATVTGEGKIARNLDLGIMIGYTYSIPQSTDPTYVYYQDKKNQYTYLFTSSDTKNNILKYRIQSLFKGDVQLTWRKFSTGFGGKYFGYMQNIDEFFINYLDDPRYGNPTGLQKYREDHHKGTFVLDYRVAYMFHDFRFSIIVNNLLNTEYSLRPLTIEAPRMSQLQVVYKI